MFLGVNAKMDAFLLENQLFDFGDTGILKPSGSKTGLYCLLEGKSI